MFEDKVNPKLLNSLVKSLSYLTRTIRNWAYSCHNDEDKVNPKFLNSLVKSLSYLTRTMEGIFFGTGLESHSMKPNALIRTDLKIANRIIAN